MFASKLPRLSSSKKQISQKRDSHSSSLIAEFPPQKTSEIKLNLYDNFSGEVNVSKLGNGVNVISKNGNGFDTSFGVYINAGRNRENFQNAGVTSFFPRLAFKSTINTSGIRVTRYVESITNELKVKAGRETVEYHADFLKPNAENVATALAEILRPRLAEWEVRDTINELGSHNTKEFSEKIVDAIYFQAFKGQGVGRIESSNFGNVTPNTIREFVNNYFVGNLVTVVGVGLDHASLLDVAEAFSYLPASGSSASPSVYHGGEHLEEDYVLGKTSLSIAYPLSSENVVSFRVLSNLLGSCVSKFETPSGSLNSRFASLVSSSANINSASSFVLDGSNGGGNYPFFVVSGSTSAGSCKDLNSGLFGELSKLDNLSEDEVRRASRLAKFQYISSLEQRDTLKNALYFGQGKNPNSSLSLFDSVTIQSLKNSISNTLNANPTVVCIGNLNGYTRQ